MNYKGIIFTDMSGYPGFGRAAGAYRIASEWRKRGMNIKVVDCATAFTVDQLKSIVDKYRSSDTEFVGFSSTFMMNKLYSVYDTDEDRARHRQEINESREEYNTPTGLARHEESELFEYIRDLGVEIVVGGWRPGSQKYDYVNYHLGPVEDKLFPNQSFEFNESEIIYTDDDEIFEGEDLPIEIARGCIFKCSFCNYNLNGKKLWDFVKSPDVLRQEMMRNYEKFGTTGYMFSDDTYNDSPEKVKKLLEMYKTLPFDLRFSSYARLDLMISKPETQEMLYESGARSLFFGIETFNHEAGKMIGKGMHPDKVKEGLLEFRRNYPDVIVYVSMIAGLPQETMEELEESYRFLTEEAKVHSFGFSPLFLSSGSEMSRNAEKYGYIRGNSERSWTRKSDGLNSFELFEWCIDKKKNYKASPAGFGMYNRIRNIGYTDDEIQVLGERDLGRLMREGAAKRKEYMDKIL